MNHSGTALVTGASRGIGRAVAIGLARGREANRGQAGAIRVVAVMAALLGVEGVCVR